MGGVCGAVSNAFSGSGSSGSPEQKKKDEAKAKAAPKVDTSKTGFQKAKDDLLMDIGAKTKDADYFARLEDRKEKSASMMTAAMASSAKDDKPAPAPAPAPKPEPAPAPPPVVTPEPPAAPAPVAEAKPITPVTKPDPVAVKEPEKTAPTEGVGAPKEPDIGAGTTTALGGEEEAEVLETVAEGEAEKKVAETVRKGRRSTIETTPQGLLAPAKTRRRRSLMGMIR